MYTFVRLIRKFVLTVFILTKFYCNCHGICLSKLSTPIVTLGYQDPYLIEQSFLLILKWGGELTKKGMLQAEELGRSFRLRYPGDHGKCQVYNLSLLKN